jgi:hypothetical protein
MNVSVCTSLRSRSECFWIDVEIISVCFSFGDNLLYSGLFVGLAGVCSWSTPCPLTGGEDAILLCQVSVC